MQTENMLICETCRYAFSEDEYFDDTCPNCPNCHSEIITEAFYCGLCQEFEPIENEEPCVSITINGANENICKDRMAGLWERYQKIMRETFSADEHEAIASYIHENGDNIEQGDI